MIEPCCTQVQCENFTMVYVLFFYLVMSHSRECFGSFDKIKMSQNYSQGEETRWRFYFSFYVFAAETNKKIKFWLLAIKCIEYCDNTKEQHYFSMEFFSTYDVKVQVHVCEYILKLFNLVWWNHRCKLYLIWRVR